MKASEITKSISTLVEQKIPTFLWGAPGIGKSSIIKEIAKSKEVAFIDLRLALMDPTDLKGIPFYDKETHSALWAPPAFLPRDGKGILFLDELNVAPPALQASAYQLILDRAVGEYKLPDGWAIVAAGNRQTDRGVTYKMPAPLANRFVHFEMEVDSDDWREWAYQNGIDPRLIAFLGYRKEALFNFDPKSDEKSFATPRSWEYVDKILKSSIESSLLLDSICGAVGKEVGVDFVSFLKVAQKLPDVDAILEGKSYQYSDEVDTLYVLSSMLVAGVLQNKEYLDNVLHYTLNLQSEFAVLIVQDLQRSGVDMQMSQAFDLWVEKFAYLLA